MDECDPFAQDCPEGEKCVPYGSTGGNWDANNIGTCTAFCTGTYDAPECAEGSHCLITNDESITLCFAECDPLLQECAEGLGCFWAQDIPPGEPCGYINDCEPGAFCAMEELLPDCVGNSCCTEYCSLSDPEACPALETTCVAFMDENLPAGYEDVGICALPPP